MKNTNFLKEIKDIVNYLKKNNLTLEPKTLKILNESLSQEELPQKYYPIFKLNTKVSNLFLSNPILWNDEAYQAIKTLCHNYDENTVLKYLTASLYEPQFYWDYLKDDRIPKVDKKNYYNLISNQNTSADMELAYQALIYPMLRNSDEVLDQVKKMNQDNNREALKNKMQILDKAYQRNLEKYKELMSKQIALFEDEEAKVVQRFLNILMRYDDWESIQFLVGFSDITKLYPIIVAFAKVQNVDEFNLVRKYFIKLANYLTLRDNILTSFDIECLEYDEYYFPMLVIKEQKELFKKSNNNAYLILEEMHEEFNKIKAKKWDLSRLKM